MPSRHKHKLSIVTLNFNRLNETRLSIGRLSELTADLPGIEIIAVDNNSTDGTAEFICNQKGIVPVLLPTNDGIAGYNEGFTRATGEYILVLDDDSCPADTQTLENLVAVLDENPHVGVIACHIQTQKGEPQWKWHLPHDGTYGPSPFFIGCGFAIRRSLFEEIGWYPEEFFLYQNEIDVTFKVRQLGYEIYYHPDCRVIHRGDLSTRSGWRCIYYPTRNTIWLIRKYYPQPLMTYMLLSRILIGLGRAAYLRQLKTYFQSLRDAFSVSVSKNILAPEIRAATTPFWRQNSIFHQIFRKI